MTVHDAQTIASPLPPVGSVRVYCEGDSLQTLVAVTSHPGMYPELVTVATEDGLRSGRRSLVHPRGLAPAPKGNWDADVLYALAIVAPEPHPQH